MSYSPNIHHKRSIRLKEYDYSRAGLYFVTICIQKRDCLFGEIINGKMILFPLGIIADIFWNKIKMHTQVVDLHKFIVMPNHIHGIIEIMENNDMNVKNVEARHTLPLQKRTQIQIPMEQTLPQSRFENQGKHTSSSIVGSYKSDVSKHAHCLGFDFAWQCNYSEHIIRDINDFHKISEYINNNIINWQTDIFYK
jgi:REP element-mobilizing transposase RayT